MKPGAILFHGRKIRYQVQCVLVLALRMTSSPISQVYFVWFDVIALVPSKGTLPVTGPMTQSQCIFSVLVSHSLFFFEYLPHALWQDIEANKICTCVPCPTRASSPREGADLKLTITVECLSATTEVWSHALELEGSKNPIWHREGKV